MEASDPHSLLVAECIRRGRAAFPQIAADAGALAGRMRPHLRGATSLEQIAAEDLFLAAACAEQDRAALQLFEARYGPEVDAAARSLGADPSFTAELRQRLFQRVLVGTAEEPPRIVDYAARGPLGA